jgi:hypothetical protein
MYLDPLVSKRLDELLVRADAIKSARTSSRIRDKTVHYVARADVLGWSASAASLLQRVFGETSTHFKTFNDVLNNFHGYEWEFDPLRAIVAAAKEDFLGGYLFSTRALAKAEVLDDALEQADALLRAGYKDPACVLIGVALESAIKELAGQAGVAIAKLDKMNVDLAKTGRYNVSKQKLITAWADLRNKAAHGQWAAYSKEDVIDLPPPSHATVKVAKSVNLENDGHENQQVQRGTDHGVPQAGGGRRAGQGRVPQGRLQRRHLLQVASQVRRHGRARRAATA